MMYPNDIGDGLTFPLKPSWGDFVWYRHLKSPDELLKPFNLYQLQPCMTIDF